MISVRVEARQVSRPWKDTLAWANERGANAFLSRDRGKIVAVYLPSVKPYGKPAHKGDWMMRLPNGEWLVLNDGDRVLWFGEQP